jgi:tRNA G10  N-methylase Trm11
MIELLGKRVSPSRRGGCLLDPFGGDGHRLAFMAGVLGMTPVAVELEQVYIDHGAHPCVQQGNARDLPFENESVDAGVTSPAYPNGVSDAWVAKDGSLHHTYQHAIEAFTGKPYKLHPDNMGGMSPRRSPKALRAFYGVQKDAFHEMWRVLKPGSPFVVNSKDPLKVAYLRTVWDQLIDAGFMIVEHQAVTAKGQRYGEHGEKRFPFEDLTVAIKIVGEPGAADIPFPR